MAKTNPIRQAYVLSRSNLRRIQRYEENLDHIRNNNLLMHATVHDRNKVYSMMKRARRHETKNLTTLPNTPVGSYHGEDVLEGFAADAEHLATLNADSPWLDHN